MTEHETTAPSSESSLPETPAAGGGSSPSCRRGNKIIDEEYQFGEVRRSIGFFLSIMIAVVAAYSIGTLLQGNARYNPGGASGFPVGPDLLASIVGGIGVMIFIYDTVRRTHRIAGAAYRLRNDAPRMLRDPSFRFRLREGDYLTDLAATLNNVMDCVDAQERERKQAFEDLEELAAKLEEQRSNIDATERQKVFAAIRRLRSHLQPTVPPSS